MLAFTVVYGKDFRALRHSLQQLPRHRQQVITNGGRSHTPGMALEQTHLQQALQVGQGLGHRRLGHANGIGRALHAAQFGQFEQHLDVPELAAGEQSLKEGGGGRFQGISKSNGIPSEFIGQVKPRR